MVAGSYATLATVAAHAPAATAMIATIPANPSIAAGWGCYDGSKTP